MASRIPNAPPDNIFSIDLTPYKSFLVDLPPGATVGMRSQQEGYTAVFTEIVGNQPKHGDRAGITTDYNRFVALHEQYGQILAQIPKVKKAVEVLRETAAHLDNQRHRLATQFADSAERHAQTEGNDPTLLTAYQSTIGYRSVIADKAVRTRQENEAAKQAGGSAPAPPAPPTPPAPPAPADPGSKAPEISRIPSPPPDIVFAIDLKPLKAFLVDLPPGATVGMRREQEGWAEVREEVINNQPTYGDRAGITASDFARFVQLDEQLQQVQMELPRLLKAEEILEESLAHVDHQRHLLISTFADAAEFHAQTEGGDPTLLTAYQKTIAYRGVVAAKAARTRKKNAELKGR